MKNKTKVNFVLLSKSGPTCRVIRTGSSGPEEDLSVGGSLVGYESPILYGDSLAKLEAKLEAKLKTELACLVTPFEQR